MLSELPISIASSKRKRMRKSFTVDKLANNDRRFTVSNDQNKRLSAVVNVD